MVFAACKICTLHAERIKEAAKFVPAMGIAMQSLSRDHVRISYIAIVSIFGSIQIESTPRGSKLSQDSEDYTAVRQCPQASRGFFGVSTGTILLGVVKTAADSSSSKRNGEGSAGRPVIVPLKGTSCFFVTDF